MFCDRPDALCGAGRGEGMRTTDGRDFTGRRSTGGVTGLTSTTFFLPIGFFLPTSFFLVAALPADPFLLLAAFGVTGGLPWPPFFDLPFAMRSFRCRSRRHFHTNDRVHSSLIS